ncbi:putative GTP-binding protein [Desulfitobacterium hafniense DCB-2]|uniref:Putative GTP-binding protein n=1 Tax=Desulfitobacterium hafniense (strain DSM 10664 / DCB-2) TaxID=272564 RepID=B8FYY1_DESHD|nr:ATP-binding protein [Desulfitobacterium hafniense]ACL22733.1 putative GTP-binding protein [Desulfitobacterium hafniense DCB-2]
MNYIKRAMENTFLRLAKEFPALLLTGPRQTGKTTMLQKLAAEEKIGRNYVTLDDLTERQMAKNDPKMFLQIHKPPVFIDEVQYAPELFSYIKIHIDRHHRPGDFWLTGSQVFKLMDGVQESLAGRVGLLHMSPMSQAESCGADTTPFILDLEQLTRRVRERNPLDTPALYERIFRGGMPALVSGQYTDHWALYSSYISTYLDRDVKEISGTINSLRFMDFITAAAALCGQMLNYKTIADAAGIDQLTAKGWLGILERLGIIFYLHPYANNMLKRMVTKPKLYFYDCGLVAYLTKWSDSATLMNGAMSGAILENFVVSEIIKSYQNYGREAFIYYYRDKDTKEIDILLEDSGKLYPMEIKKTATPQKQLTRVFNVIDKATLERGTGAVLCTTDRLSAFDSENLIIPIWGI